MENTIKDIIETLEHLFKTFNDKFYDGKLEQPIITVSPNSNTCAYGWFTTWKAWQKEGSDGYYEINICAEYLNRPMEEIVGTLLHEMAHLYARANGIKDTSRGCTYHNKKFKEIAESHGLVIEHDDKYGWTKTTIAKETVDFLYTMLVNVSAFELHRTEMPIEEKKKRGSGKSSSRKYVCPMCGMSIRATKEVHIMCGDCKCDMELEGGDED